MAPSAATLADVRQRVRAVIAHFAGKNEADLDDGEDLRDDDGLGEIHLRALAKPFTHISEDHGGQAVNQTEVTACDTPGDCVKLVSGKLP